MCCLLGSLTFETTSVDQLHCGHDDDTPEHRHYEVTSPEFATYQVTSGYREALKIYTPLLKFTVDEELSQILPKFHKLRDLPFKEAISTGSLSLWLKPEEGPLVPSQDSSDRFHSSCPAGNQFMYAIVIGYFLIPEYYHRAGSIGQRRVAYTGLEGLG